MRHGSCPAERVARGERLRVGAQHALRLQFLVAALSRAFADAVPKGLILSSGTWNDGR